MSSVNLQAWADIAALVLKYGIPAVREIIAAWAVDMTEDEIRARIGEYRAGLMRPEEYFGHER